MEIMIVLVSGLLAAIIVAVKGIVRIARNEKKLKRFYALRETLEDCEARLKESADNDYQLTGEDYDKLKEAYRELRALNIPCPSLPPKEEMVRPEDL